MLRFMQAVAKTRSGGPRCSSVRKAPSHESGLAMLPLWLSKVVMTTSFGPHLLAGNRSDHAQRQPPLASTVHGQAVQTRLSLSGLGFDAGASVFLDCKGSAGRSGER